MSLQHHTDEVNISSKIIAGLIPSHQRRVILLARQGLRPGQISHHLGIGLGGVDRVWHVLSVYGVKPASRRAQA